MYAILTYSAIRGIVNVGDFIQSLAAKQFLPHTDIFWTGNGFPHTTVLP